VPLNITHPCVIPEMGALAKAEGLLIPILPPPSLCLVFAAGGELDSFRSALQLQSRLRRISPDRGVIGTPIEFARATSAASFSGRQVKQFMPLHRRADAQGPMPNPPGPRRNIVRNNTTIASARMVAPQPLSRCATGPLSPSLMLSSPWQAGFPTA
jgi:hypothetical protein